MYSPVRVGLGGMVRLICDNVNEVCSTVGQLDEPDDDVDEDEGGRWLTIALLTRSLEEEVRAGK